MQKRGDFVNCEIKVGSVTNAQRGSKILRKNGYKSSVHRLENPSAGDGCGFVIRIDGGDSHYARELLGRNGVRILGVREY